MAADARQREDDREREVVTFFASLAKRRRREVDLSDVTYAVLQALPVLCREFARFLGVPVQEHDHIILEREVAVHGGLADFLFEGPTWKLLVENKINDRNYHVDQYELGDGDQKTPHYGLIAAHRVDPGQLTEAKKKWTIRHWDEWLEVLREQGWASHPLVAGYIAYVQEVCRLLPPVEPFTLDPSGVSALGRFYLLLEHVLNQSVETPVYTREWRRWDCNRFGAGAYITVGKPGRDARKFPVWFGLLYERCALGGEVEQRLLPQEVWREVDRLTHELTTQGWEAWRYRDGVVYWAPGSLERMNQGETVAEKKRLVEDLLDAFCRALVSIA